MSLNKKFIFTTAFFAASISAVMLGFFQFSSLAEASRTEAGELFSKIEALREQRMQAQRVKNLLGERKGDIERIKNFFVNRELPIRFIELLENAARRTGNTIVLNAENNPSRAHIVTFRISIKGTRQSVTTFFDVMDALPHEININSLRYTAPQTRGSAEAEIAFDVATR